MESYCSSARPGGIACFSYLSAVTTLHTARYPAADYGAEVHQAERFIAADGPIVAAAAVMLGHRATLLSNSVAADETGDQLKRQLEAWGVTSVFSASARRAITPFSTVIAAADGSRTWFPYLPGVVSELVAADLSALLSVEFAYVDCYEILDGAARRPVAAALANGIPVLANLGGSPLPDWLRTLDTRSRLAVLQTSVADHEAHEAGTLAGRLSSLRIADLVVVTRGRHGAVAADGHGCVEATALPVKATRTQGAGSVFSAMLASRLLSGATAASALRFACAAGSLWCATEGDPPSLEDVRSFAEDHRYALT
jgi:sugar/nucleoside kinase (ribokinase family)